MKKAALLVLSFCMVGVFAIFTQTALASPATDACETLKLADPSAKCDNSPSAQKGFNDIMRQVINILSIVVGGVSVVMLIIGGFRYVVSGGDSNGVQGAKNTILYALVGLVVVLFAQVIVKFVLSNVTK